MPNKVDRSHLMSDTQFFSIWEEHKAVIFYVIKRYANKYPLHTTPGNCCVEDTASNVMLEFRRLGVFARWDAERTANMGHYVGAMTKSVISHLWQDYCRLNNRAAVKTVARYADGESMDNGMESQWGTSGTTNALPVDPDFLGWGAFDYEDSATDKASMSNSTLKRVHAVVKGKSSRSALDLLRQGATAPTATAVSVALAISPATARETLRAISDALASVIAEEEGA